MYDRITSGGVVYDSIISGGVALMTIGCQLHSRDKSTADNYGTPSYSLP